MHKLYRRNERGSGLNMKSKPKKGVVEVLRYVADSKEDAIERIDYRCCWIEGKSGDSR